MMGLGATFFAYSYQYEELGDDEIPPAGTYNLNKLDLFDIAGGEEGIQKDQFVLRDGKIVVRADGSGTIKARIRINNFQDLPNGTFTVQLDGSIANDTGKLTVNGRVVTNH